MELAYAFTPLNFTLGKIAISFLIGIPIIMIIYMAIKLLFSFKSNNKVIALSALSCWMLGLVILIFVGISEGRSWSIDGTRYGESLELSQQDTLVLLVNERYKIPENLSFSLVPIFHSAPAVHPEMTFLKYGMRATLH